MIRSDRIKPFLEVEKARVSGIPQEVVEAYVLRNEPLIKAWREYLGITQEELAARWAYRRRQLLG